MRDSIGDKAKDILEKCEKLSSRCHEITIIILDCFLFSFFKLHFIFIDLKGAKNIYLFFVFIDFILTIINLLFVGFIKIRDG